MRKFLQILMIFFTGFVGGVSGSLIFQPSSLYAASAQSNKKQDKAKYFSEYFNTADKRIAYLGQGQIGQGGMFLFSNSGKVTLQASSYVKPIEQGQSFIGLYDRDELLRLLFRLYSSQDSPTIVLKDKSGQDRLVIGLQGAGEHPYIRYMDSSGIMHDLITGK